MRTIEKTRKAAAAAIALVALACGAERPSGQAGGSVTGPNVVLVTIDTLRADHCSSYGYGRETTPRLDRLAAEGTRVELAYAPMPTTGPSHSTIFTSLYPITHGVLKNGWPLAESHETLAEILDANGYATAAVVSSFPLAGKFGFAQGFAHYDDDFGEGDGRTRRWEGLEVEGRFDRRADATSSRAVERLEQLAADGKPFFLWMHLFDPHWPYDPPPALRDAFPAGAVPPEKRRDARAVSLYDAEVLFADRALGDVVDALERLGLDRSTLVIATSDHGEGLGQHSHWAHGLLVYEEAVRVPLVFRWTGKLPAGRTLEGPVEHVDLLPTILDLVGLQRVAGTQGTSLAPFLRGRGSTAAGRGVFVQRRYYEEKSDEARDVRGEKFGVRQGTWKYIEAAEEGLHELYDLAADPGELSNVAPAHPEESRRLSEAIRTWRATARKPKGLPPGVSAEDAAKLRALGYVQ